ncbi:unnamed protein product [Pseudo-nitzschia multistriata]|uniref:J domain-containing protein n=1 Tax=Pseudo-nitzschia multistriata TaxID=183589 RepID=A0A448ZFW9_9STRA|nr:unnamed protein product [Pseudo-nitzschia multistriata]
MQYFDCCPVAISDDVVEDMAITTQQDLPENGRNAAIQSNARTQPLSRKATWNAVDCNSPVNPYHVLELRRDATHAEIIGSYRKLALIYHPGRKIASSIERRKRLQFFEILAACYETLMHNEFRRRCDSLLKEIDKKECSKSKANHKKPGNLVSYNKKVAFFTPGVGKQQSLQASNELVARARDPIPGLMSSSSDSSSASGKEVQNAAGNSCDSNDTIPRNNCTSLGVGMLICAGDSAALHNPKSSNSVKFAISRNGTKGFRSLVDSSSLSASQASAEEAEIHFSEATVNRLFGGPLASLHRARNFQAFSDPYVVFDKVFGNQKPIFPRVTLADIDDSAASNGESIYDVTTQDWHGMSGNTMLIRSSITSLMSSNIEINDTKKTKNCGDNSNDKVDDSPTIDTKIFVATRVVNGRKITKTETVHVDPLTGIASVNVTVDGEFLEPITKSKTSHTSPEGSVADWLLCFGMAQSKIIPPPCTTATESASLLVKPSASASSCCPNSKCDDPCPSKHEFSSSCNDFKSLYVQVLQDFYDCNKKFYEECNRYMQCGVENGTVD